MFIKNFILLIFKKNIIYYELSFSLKQNSKKKGKLIKYKKLIFIKVNFNFNFKFIFELYKYFFKLILLKFINKKKILSFLSFNYTI